MRMVLSFGLGLSAIGLAAPQYAAAQARPVVAVLYFDNNSLGRDRADYDGLGKGIADLLVTDMLANPAVRVVERERVQSLLIEQNLVRQRAINPETAIRLGRIVGAQYMITGGFISDGKGRLVLTSRVINVETSEVSNTQKLESRDNDVLALIGQLSSKLDSQMQLPAQRLGDAGAAAEPTAIPAGQPAASAQPSAPAAEAAQPAAGKSAASKPAAKSSAKTGPKPRRMDIRTALLYSKALEEEDAGNRSRAIELYRQVDVAFPDYAPVRKKLTKLTAS